MRLFFILALVAITNTAAHAQTSYPMYREVYTWSNATNNWQFFNKQYTLSFDTIARKPTHTVILNANNDTLSQNFQTHQQYPDSIVITANTEIYNGGFLPYNQSKLSTFTRGNYPFAKYIDIKRTDSTGTMQQYAKETSYFNAQNYPILYEVARTSNPNNTPYSVRFGYDTQNRLDSTTYTSYDTLGNVITKNVAVNYYHLLDSCPYKIVNLQYDTALNRYNIDNAKINMVWQNCVAGNYEATNFNYYQGKLLRYNEYNDNGDSTLVINNFLDGFTAVSTEVYPITGIPNIPIRYTTTRLPTEIISLVEHKINGNWVKMQQQRRSFLPEPPRYPTIYIVSENWIGNAWSAPDSIENNQYTFSGIDIQQLIQRRISNTFMGINYTNKYIYGNFLHLSPPTGTTDPTPAPHSNVKVYPNPVRGSINVQFSEGWAGSATVAIYDAMGKKVRQQTTQATTTAINISGLAAGIYTLKVSGNNANTTHKLVVY